MEPSKLLASPLNDVAQRVCGAHFKRPTSSHRTLRDDRVAITRPLAIERCEQAPDAKHLALQGSDPASDAADALSFY